MTESIYEHEYIVEPDEDQTKLFSHFIDCFKDPELDPIDIMDLVADMGNLEGEGLTNESKDSGTSGSSGSLEASVQQIGQQMSGQETNQTLIKIEDNFVKIEPGIHQLTLAHQERMRQLEEVVKLQPKLSKVSSKRDNNTILKPIFTKFKKLIRKHKPFKNFFQYRTYKENKVSLIDFEKLFSYAEIKGLFHELKQLLINSYEGLAEPKTGYTASRMTSYHDYIDRIYSALCYADDYSERMDILYSYRKHHFQLEQIETFRRDLLKEQEAQKPA